MNSGTPRVDAEECALLDAANCRAMFCHTPWYRDLIAKHRGPANQSEIVLWPYPIDPWPGEPLPDEYDLLIYAKNGHRPQLLEHLADAFPRHVQIHYGSYRRDELFEAARRSRACAYLADDDHGPLALHELLLAGCPTVGVRTGASFVRHGETGILVDRLPPGASCVECEADAVALDALIDAIEQAQAIDRPSVRAIAAEQFDTTRIVDGLHRVDSDPSVETQRRLPGHRRRVHTQWLRLRFAGVHVGRWDHSYGAFVGSARCRWSRRLCRDRRCSRDQHGHRLHVRPSLLVDLDRAWSRCWSRSSTKRPRR